MFKKRTNSQLKKAEQLRHDKVTNKNNEAKEKLAIKKEAASIRQANKNSRIDYKMRKAQLKNERIRQNQDVIKQKERQKTLRAGVAGGTSAMVTKQAQKNSEAKYASELEEMINSTVKSGSKDNSSNGTAESTVFGVGDYA